MIFFRTSSQFLGTAG